MSDVPEIIDDLRRTAIATTRQHLLDLELIFGSAENLVLLGDDYLGRLDRSMQLLEEELAALPILVTDIRAAIRRAAARPIVIPPT